jgi:hypothetical protein
MAGIEKSGGQGISTTHPELVFELHQTKNGDFNPNLVSAGSHKKPWWKCTKGHEWQAIVSSRARGASCPYCSGNKPWAGETDLETTNPDLAKQWHPTKNGELLPSKVLAGYATKVWWLCEKGHSWEIAPANRKLGSGCPYCSGNKPWAGFNDLGTLYPVIAAQWHSTLNGDLKPSGITSKSNQSIWWQCPLDERHVWKDSVNHRTGMNRNCAVCRGYKVIPGVNDLGSSFPEVASEWHPTKNGKNTPQTLTVASNVTSWWKCKEGHEWQARITHRVNGSKCPFCSGRDAIEGVNDLATTHPDLANQWDLSLNKKNSPRNTKAFSAYKAWWLCSKKHSWKAAVSSRAVGSGCPYCSGLLPIQGETDLGTLRPELVKEWHPTKNGQLLPSGFTVGTSQRVWWLCSEKHEWKTAISGRSIQGSGCPRCASYGYDSTKPGLLYFISNEALRARKVGITNVETRVSRLKDFATLGWVELMIVKDEDGLLIKNAETQILRWIRKGLELPAFLTKSDMGRHGGHSETFSIDGPSNSEVISKIESTIIELRN